MADKQMFTNPKINNGGQAVGNHCTGIGQLKKTVILKYDQSINQPEVFIVQDPNTGEYQYTDIDARDLVLTQAEIDAYLAMKTIPAQDPWYQPLV